MSTKKHRKKYVFQTVGTVETWNVSEFLTAVHR